MYSISRQNNIKYGNVIKISIIDIGEFETPFQAYNKALTMKRLWLEEDGTKVKFLVDSQLLTSSQLQHWANEEYKFLKKCQSCNKILNDKVFLHKLSTNLFCSQMCCDKDMNYRLEKMNEDEDCD